METDKNTVARVMDWHNLGVKPGNIASALEAEGIKLPVGASGWNSETVKGILADAGVAITEDRMGAGEDIDDDEMAWPGGHCGARFSPDLP